MSDLTAVGLGRIDSLPGESVWELAIDRGKVVSAAVPRDERSSGINS